jgi:hypothetical protein
MPPNYHTGGGPKFRLTKPARALLAHGTEGSEEDDPETFRRWADFWNDAGGQTDFIQRAGVPYIWYDTPITNNEQTWTFAWADTQAHESVHAFVGRVFPLTRYFSMRETGPVTNVLAASLRQFEETIAYTTGHVAALRPHGVAVGWLEAFTTLEPEHQRRTLFVGGFLIGAPAFVVLSAASLVYLGGVGVYETGRGTVRAGRAVGGGIRRAWTWLTT